MKKLLLLLALSSTAMIGGEIFAYGTSNSFRIQSDQLVASGAMSTSDSFTVQTKTIQVGSQSSAPSFKVYNADEHTPTNNTGGNNTGGGNTGGGQTPDTGGNNSGSGGGGGGRRTYNPQAILNGKYTTDKGIRYESKVTADSKKSDNFYFAQKSYDLSFDNEKNTETVALNTNKTTTTEQPTVERPSKVINQDHVTATTKNDLIVAPTPTIKTIKTNLNIAPKKNRDDYWLTFFKESGEFEESSQKILAQSEDVFFNAAPTQITKETNWGWIWILIAFLVGVIVGASTEHMRHIKTHSQNLWQKIKDFALKIWKI